MRTGQASTQAPHRLLACGNSLPAPGPASAGMTTLPTGPG